MDPKAIKLARLFKRLKAAVGYHELGMAEHAVQILGSLASLGDIGPFAFVADILRDEFLRGSADDFSAASALEVAEALAPRDARRAIRMTLVTCFGDSPETENGRSSRPSLATATGR
jgi:hypothetical protein